MEGWRDLGEEPLDRMEFWGLSVRGDPIEFCWVRMDLRGASCAWLLVDPLQWLWSVPNNLEGGVAVTLVFILAD